MSIRPADAPAAPSTSPAPSRRRACRGCGRTARRGQACGVFEHAQARASVRAPPRLRLRADTHQSLRPADEARWTSAPSVCASAPPASCSAAGVGQLLYARATPSWCVLSIETETDWSPNFFEWNYACAFGLLYGIDHLLSHMERSTERWPSELWIRVQAAPSWHRPAFTQNLQSSPCAGARDVAVTEAGASPGLDIGGC